MLDFQVSQVSLVIPVKEAHQESQVNQDFLGLQVVQVPQVGRGSKEIWGLLGQLE